MKIKKVEEEDFQVLEALIEAKILETNSAGDISYGPRATKVISILLALGTPIAPDSVPNAVHALVEPNSKGETT